MRTKWKKMLILAADAVIGIYLVAAVSSFNRPNEDGWVCKRVNIYIQDEATNGFITRKEIVQRLKQAKLYPVARPMSAIDVRSIEEKLEQSAFVNNAECSKTIGGDVNISITQRMPVVRIKSDNGEDYYVDDNDCVMPNSHYTSDLIIVTGAVSKNFATRYAAPLAKTINHNELWKNQIVQINVLPDRSIEIVPRVGDHIVNIGTLPALQDKQQRQKAIEDFVLRQLERLRKFYVYGLSKAGWNKYSYISLEFSNQIICKKRNSTQ